MGISPLGDNLNVSSDVRSTQDTRSNQVDQAQQSQLDRRQRARETDDGGDSVSLSSLGSELARSLASENPEEVNRVEQLHQAVNSGALHAASQATAARVVEDALVGQQVHGRPGVDAPPAPH